MRKFENNNTRTNDIVSTLQDPLHDFKINLYLSYIRSCKRTQPKLAYCITKRLGYGEKQEPRNDLESRPVVDGVLLFAGERGMWFLTKGAEARSSLRSAWFKAIQVRTPFQTHPVSH